MSLARILYRVTAPKVSLEQCCSSSLILRAGGCELTIDMPATGESVAMTLRDETQSIEGTCHV